MKQKRNALRFSFFLILGILVSIAVVRFLRIGTFYSAVRLGYIEQSGTRNWSADYSLLDGEMSRALRFGSDPSLLQIEVTTEEGTLSIEISDSDGTVFFDQSVVKNAVFEAVVRGKVVVQITADRHKGGFVIESAQ